MFRKITTTIAAAAVALTSLSVAPARADSDDAARALAALLGLVVIGKIIHDSNDDDEVVTRRRPADPVLRPHRRTVEPRPLPRRVHRKLLPQECFRSFDTRDGRVRMFGRKCLEKRYDRVDRLPRRCARQIETYRGTRVGYEARCLRRKGYRLSRG